MASIFTTRATPILTRAAYAGFRKEDMLLQHMEQWFVEKFPRCHVNVLLYDGLILRTTDNEEPNITASLDELGATHEVSIVVKPWALTGTTSSASEKWRDICLIHALRAIGIPVQCSTHGPFSIADAIEVLRPFGLTLRQVVIFVRIAYGIYTRVCISQQIKYPKYLEP